MGLLAAVELVRDKSTKEKISVNPEATTKLTEILQEHGLLGRAGDVIPIAPPLCITRDEIDHFVERLDTSISKMESSI